jgi:hypothetical protein
MTINVTTADRRPESISTADDAYKLIRRLAHPGDNIDVTISVAEQREEDEAAKFINSLFASERFRSGVAVTGNRTFGDAYKVFIRVSA